MLLRDPTAVNKRKNQQPTTKQNCFATTALPGSHFCFPSRGERIFLKRRKNKEQMLMMMMSLITSSLVIKVASKDCKLFHTH
jgi:hypothetical protein